MEFWKSNEKNWEASIPSLNGNTIIIASMNKES